MSVSARSRRKGFARASCSEIRALLTFPSGITVISLAGCAVGRMRTNTWTVSLRLIATACGRSEETGCVNERCGSVQRGEQWSAESAAVTASACVASLAGYRVVSRRWCLDRCSVSRRAQSVGFVQSRSSKTTRVLRTRPCTDPMTLTALPPPTEQ